MQEINKLNKQINKLLADKRRNTVHRDADGCIGRLLIIESDTMLITIVCIK